MVLELQSVVHLNHLYSTSTFGSHLHSYLFYFFLICLSSCEHLLPPSIFFLKPFSMCMPAMDFSATEMLLTLMHSLKAHSNLLLATKTSNKNNSCTKSQL